MVVVEFPEGCDFFLAEFAQCPLSDFSAPNYSEYVTGKLWGLSENKEIANINLLI